MTTTQPMAESQAARPSRGRSSGWKGMAFPGPRSDWWTTTIAPTAGAIAGGYFYDFVIQPFMPRQEAKPAGQPLEPATEKGSQ